MAEITGDVRHWFEQVVELCAAAQERGATALFRNDDDQIIVCSSKDPEVIRSLGESLGFVDGDGFSPEGGG